MTSRVSGSGVTEVPTNIRPMTAASTGVSGGRSGSISGASGGGRPGGAAGRQRAIQPRTAAVARTIQLVSDAPAAAARTGPRSSGRSHSDSRSATRRNSGCERSRAYCVPYQNSSRYGRVCGSTTSWYWTTLGGTGAM